MKASDVISGKLLKVYPKSFEIFEESCQYSIDNGLDFIKGVLLQSEKVVPYNEFNSVCEQVFAHLKELGYKYMTANHNGNFKTKEGHKSGFVFVVFLSKAALDAYNNENDAFTKWTHSRHGEQPSRAIYNAINHLDIYKSFKLISGDPENEDVKLRYT